MALALGPDSTRLLMLLEYRVDLPGRSIKVSPDRPGMRRGRSVRVNALSGECLQE